MLDKMTGSLDFHAKALVLRADRQRIIASNIANADTPDYKGRNFDFNKAMQDALQGDDRLQPQGVMQRATHPLHLIGAGVTASSDALWHENSLGYTVQTQPSHDNNTVDLDQERADFVDNSVRYEATLRFINGQAKTLLGAITGQ